jgi:hypothetical protein
MTVGISAARAEVFSIDFTKLSAYTAISNEDGITFSLKGGPGPDGTPVIDQYVPFGLTNTIDGTYNTSAILQVNFVGPASNIHFGFDNGDSNYTSTATAFGASGNVLQVLNIGNNGNEDTYSMSASGVTELQFNTGMGSGTVWEFDLLSLSANDPLAFPGAPPGGVAAVPEPVSMAVLGSGLFGLGLIRRRLR